MTVSDQDQFETFVSIKAYCARILAIPDTDNRPSIMRDVVKHISRMHNLKDRLDSTP